MCHIDAYLGKQELPWQLYLCRALGEVAQKPTLLLYQERPEHKKVRVYSMILMMVYYQSFTVSTECSHCTLAYFPHRNPFIHLG